jgi:membrane-bound lytic murein transglycosylase A
MNTLTQKVLIALGVLAFVACARSPIKDKNEALRLTTRPITVQDDLGMDIFAQDLSKYTSALQKTNFSKQIFTYSEQVWLGAEVLKAYQDFAKFIDSKPSLETINAYLLDKFQWLEVYGTTDWSTVFVTSYFEPLYEGSLVKTTTHTHPLYVVPKDLVQIDLEGFSKTHSQLEPYLGYIAQGQPGPRTLTGRFDEKTKKVYPYYSREDIVENNKLSRKNLEIVWLNPVDNFFLQIQGSGTIALPNKKTIQVGYAAQNGHAYVAIGKFVTDKIPLEELTMAKLEAYLKSLPYEEQAKILNQNPSYVFFQKLKSRPLTSQGTEVIDGRTIATDSFYLPKGLIGLLEFDKPKMTTEPSFETVRRFIFNQDSGGAIRGPGRVDLFWGKGIDAGMMAGSIKHNGRLWFLFPKKNLL